MRTHVTRTLALLLPLCAGSVAHAGTVVLAPFLSDGSVGPKQQTGLHQLIASELDFSPGVDGVVDLDAPPANLNDACLANPGCLGQITQANGGNQMLAGRVQGAGGALMLDIVFFDGRTIARRKQFQVPGDASGMANAMTPIVQEMLNGGGSGPKAAPVVAAVPDLDDGPALADQIAGPPPVDRRVAAANTAQNYPPPPPPAPVPLPPPVVVPAPAPMPVAAPAPIDPMMITFKTTAADLSADQVNSMIRFGPPAGGTPAPAPMPMPMAQPMPVAMPMPPPPAPAPRNNGTRIAEEEQELEAMEKSRTIVDLDDDRRSSRGSTGPVKQGGTTGTIQDELGHTVQFTGRGGFCKYYGFNFVTGGGELGVALTGGLHAVAGVELYAVHRILPPDVAAETRIYAEWNTIYPGNVGLIYKFPIGIAQPYVGADAIFTQYYKDDIGADWAGGARVRGGIDLMFVKNFGINVNVAAGGWYGQNWPLIEQGTGAAGFLPQASGGTVIAF